MLLIFFMINFLSFWLQGTQLGFFKWSHSGEVYTTSDIFKNSKFHLRSQSLVRKTEKKTKTQFLVNQ